MTELDEAAWAANADNITHGQVIGDETNGSTVLEDLVALVAIVLSSFVDLLELGRGAKGTDSTGVSILVKDRLSAR